MDETYRMLGNERQADFDREAARAHRAALLPRKVRERRRFAIHIPSMSARARIRADDAAGAPGDQLAAPS
jgi:hypothetical protein